MFQQPATFHVVSAFQLFIRRYFAAFCDLCVRTSAFQFSASPMRHLFDKIAFERWLLA